MSLIFTIFQVNVINILMQLIFVKITLSLNFGVAEVNEFSYLMLMALYLRYLQIMHIYLMMKAFKYT
jgi:hypothetical protein